MAVTRGRDDDGRWQELRLVVQRPLGENAVWAIAVRHVAGGRRRDQLISRGTIPMPPGSPQSAEWWTALHTALMAACEGRSCSEPLAGGESGVPLGGP